MNKIWIVGLVIGLMTFGCMGMLNANQQSETICVKSKFIDAGESSHYVIISTDDIAYEIDRSVINMFQEHSNPDVMYGNMQIGKQYTITTTGYRINVMYNYPLIQSIEDKNISCS